ncbi:MAG: hypothetical protein JSR58_02890 [Verrucomicrobia bacterium]|nr:hypothetical protein [Verrucomicrobiota bacterium]
MKIPSDSLFRSIPGGHYTIGALVGLVALITAVFLKRRWDNSGVSQNSPLRIDSGLEKKSKEKPARAPTETVKVFKMGEEGRVGFDFRDFSKITKKGLFTTHDRPCWDFATDSGTEISNIYYKYFSFVKINKNEIVLKETRKEPQSYQVENDISLFDLDSANLVTASGNGEITIINRGSRQLNSCKISGEILHVKIVLSSLIIITKKGIVALSLGLKEQWRYPLKGEGILSAKAYYDYKDKFVLLEREDKIEVGKIDDSKDSQNLYPSENFDKPAACKGPCQTLLTEKFIFLVPEGQQMIFQLDHSGKVLSRLEASEPVQDLQWDDGKLYATGTNKGFIWDLSK